MRLRLEYFDQNDGFAAVLPAEGVVERRLKAADESDWVLFRLDRPVEYEGRAYRRFLLKSRWAGYAIGGAEPASVFILLVPDAAQVSPGLIHPGFDVKQFEHVAWGMVHTIASPHPETGT